MERSVYEVWAFGVDKDNFCTDVEILMAKFGTEEQAVKFAECFEKEDIIENYSEQIKEFGELEPADCFEIRVQGWYYTPDGHREFLESLCAHWAK